MLKKYRYRYRYRPIAYFLSGQTICLGLLSKTEYRQLPALLALQNISHGLYKIAHCKSGNERYSVFDNRPKPIVWPLKK